MAHGFQVGTWHLKKKEKEKGGKKGKRGGKREAKKEGKDYVLYSNCILMHWRCDNINHGLSDGSLGRSPPLIDPNLAFTTLLMSLFGSGLTKTLFSTQDESKMGCAGSRGSVAAGYCVLCCRGQSFQVHLTLDYSDAIFRGMKG
jgi:hypothetical protein